MAYVPKCVYDVFLSYAHVDNAPTVAEPWVDRFKKELEAELRGELAVCVGDQRFVVWQDLERLKPGFALTQSIRDALSKTAVVISLYSPAYIASGYCADERSSFEQQCGDALHIGESSRLINVVIRSRPDVVRLASTALFAKLFNSAGPLPFNSEEFRSQFKNLTQAIKRVLEEMRQGFPKAYVALSGTAGDPTLVALASKNTERLLEDLSQAGYARTTEVHPGFYTDAQLAQEISEAKISVHVVTDPTDPLTKRQIEAACKVGVPTLVWLAPSAQGPESDYILKTLPGYGGEYSRGAFSIFCDRVKQVIDHTVNGQPVIDAEEKRKTVFVLRHPKIAEDKEGAEKVRRRLIGRGLDVTYQWPPAWKGLDGVLVYQRQADTRWFTTKLEFVASAPIVRAACPVAPPDKTESMSAAEDYAFKRASAVDGNDPRMLLDGDDNHHLEPFLSAVLAR